MYTLQPEKKSSGWPKVLLPIGIIALMFAAATIANRLDLLPSTPVTTDNSVSASQSHNVVYKITTNRDSSVWPSCYGFDVTYEMGSGTSQKKVNICDGAKMAEVDRFTGSSGDFVYLSVQNDEYLAHISCEIHIDGKRVYHTYSEGQYVIASCSGSIP